MTLRLAPAAVDMTALEAEIDTVRQTAEYGVARAENARTMVLKRDPRLDTVEGRTQGLADALAQLETLTTTLGQAISASEQTHAAIYQTIADISLKPGPAGPQGLRGPSGADGVLGQPGKDGASGPSGPSGTASLGLGACSVGLVAIGGSVTLTIPWSRTMPASYQTAFAHSAVVDLTAVTFAVQSRSAAYVVVKVTAHGAALAAGTIVALGW